ncbi:glycine receptor subunit alpha-2-like [Gigantopelta aegis]|uniref:glycine receptor subunit alpha-2-like n=1 Tax=Gigantopelta aegis TaxID=1735272 RepID=UPI001B88881B|nr:glycine receptor subunit alpha-2-like [Gigantopelta aegis]
MGKNMKFGASFYLRQEWQDKRLQYNELNRSILLSYKRLRDIWVPDLFFPKSKEEVGFDITTPNVLLRISPDGTVLYTQRVFVNYNCMMDLRKFPHDSQTCRIQMESYSFTTDDLTFAWSSARKATKLLPDASMPDFNVISISAHDCTATYATGTFPCLYAKLVMKRQVGFYLTQTYIPSILIVSLSWISFWIDHQAIPARISVGLLTVLTITTQSSGAMAQLPRVPYIKSIDVWMSTCLVFVFAAYMEYAFVTVLSRRHRKAYIRQPRTTTNNDKTSIEDISIVDTNGKCDTTTGVRRRAFFRKNKSDEQTSSASLPPRDIGAHIDKISRFAFPIAFVLFNLFYWIFYTIIL